MRKKVEVEERFCDICGAPADGVGSIIARGQGYKIIYESKVIGDYCPEHADALLMSALRNGGIAERYDGFDTDDDVERQKAVERALIEDEYVSSFERCQQLEQVALDAIKALDDGDWLEADALRDRLEALGVSIDD